MMTFDLEQHLLPMASFEACQTAGLSAESYGINALCVNTTTGEVVTIAN